MDQVWVLSSCTMPPALLHSWLGCGGSVSSAGPWTWSRVGNTLCPWARHKHNPADWSLEILRGQKGKYLSDWGITNWWLDKLPAGKSFLWTIIIENHIRGRKEYSPSVGAFTISLELWIGSGRDNRGFGYLSNCLRVVLFRPLDFCWAVLTQWKVRNVYKLQRQRNCM